MKMETGKLHGVILAGGSGTRFWPLSRELLPKQLLSILDERSMLALTLDRILPLIQVEDVRIVTIRSQAGEVRRELASLGRPEIRVLEEPEARNTAAAIGLAAVEILRDDPQGILAVFPADHHILDARTFTELIQRARKVAAAGWLVTLGIQPTRPETGYGYIQRGDLLEGHATQGAYRVRRFTEKPDRETAEEYLRTGEYYWNSGIFLWRADLFMEEMRRHLPEHHRVLQKIASLPEDKPGREDRIRELYGALESISVDYGIMERSDRVAVIPAEMGWNDVGSWAAVHDLMEKDENGNVLRGDVVALDTRNSLIRSEDRLVAVLGVEDLVVVDTTDAVLVCPRERVQEVRRIAELLREQNRDEARIHRRVEKPWGAYKVLDLGDQYQVKWLEVKPGQRLSYQSHEHRSEHWTVVIGTATVTLDDEVIEVPTGGHVYIPVRAKHRLENRGKKILRVIEVQSGDYLGEDDIVRYEDDYGRTG